ncbi:MAG: hypothetical protein SGI88_08725 [Candidatus Hydrogenedentes bacterium]|nr:hypothetical protein [Candidatus Hydrogenedentota bacterium]
MAKLSVMIVLVAVALLGCTPEPTAPGAPVPSTALVEPAPATAPVPETAQAPGETKSATGDDLGDLGDFEPNNVPDRASSRRSSTQ